MNPSQRIPRSLSSSSNALQCLKAPTQPSSTRSQQTRAASSFRRTQKALRVQPAEHFTKTTQTDDHIIFNPPSSAPNVYHTPLAFLPQNDPRRRLHALRTTTTSTTSTTLSSSNLPPSVRPIAEKKYHLSAADVDEIRRLRTEDPRQWTRVRLAEKFGCSQFFVSLCGTAPAVAEQRQKELEEIKKKWGRAKREAREDRLKRKELWGRE